MTSVLYVAQHYDLNWKTIKVLDKAHRGGPKKPNTFTSGSSRYRAGPQGWQEGALHGQENKARTFGDAES